MPILMIAKIMAILIAAMVKAKKQLKQEQALLSLRHQEIAHVDLSLKLLKSANEINLLCLQEGHGKMESTYA